MSEAEKKWGALANDEPLLVDSIHNILAGKIQEKYGIVKKASTNRLTSGSLS